MAAEIKAVVFKTAQLKATKEFFITTLNVSVKESSATHFVIHSKGIRILFVESGNNLGVELYLNKRSGYDMAANKPAASILAIPGLILHEDPNGIKIIISC